VKKRHGEVGDRPRRHRSHRAQDNTVFYELSFPEEWGFCQPGEAEHLLESGQTLPNGRLPINPSGGFISFGEATTAQGLFQICELGWQLRGERRPAGAGREGRARAVARPRRQRVGRHPEALTMGGEPTLDFVPEDLSPEAREKLLALARESRPEPAAIEVDEYLIRHWCETLEDGNPLYLDAEYARSRGYRGVVAPPGSVMTTFAMPLRWPWPPGGREPAPHIHYQVKELLNLPVGIINKIEVEVGVPLQVGDRVSVSQRLVSVSPWKKTRVGEGHFWTMDRLYRNQAGELVLRERMTAFGYGRQASAPGAASSKGGWSPAVEEVIRGAETGYRPAPPRDRFWEDVKEGEELPRLVMPITTTRCVYLASATRDFSPQHSNREYARSGPRRRTSSSTRPSTWA
jgi:acyl dehydratase